jgi:hypothetical protein
MPIERKPENKVVDEDESLNLELIRKWEANHSKVKGESLEIKEQPKSEK